MRKKYLAVICLAFCVLIPAAVSAAGIKRGMPKREMLFRMAEECLEQYRFCGIHPDQEAMEQRAREAAEQTEGQAAGQTEGQIAGSLQESSLFVPEHYIMVGDSRFEGMEQAVEQAGDTGCTWICQVSAGLSWFSGTAVPEIDAAVTDKTAIIINMGVNDLDHVSEYVDILCSKVPEWMAQGAVVYYMSVNPVENHSLITNEDIQEFNRQIYNQMPQEMGWIETNSYLMEHGYEAPDGVHFDADTYRTIYDYTMAVIAGFSRSFV